MIRFGFSFQVINLCKTFGDDGGGVPHVPIPNTTVKPSSADGTWTAGSWESRTSPSEQARLCFTLRFSMKYLEALLYAGVAQLVEQLTCNQ